VAIDTPAPTFRHLEYKEYKAQRQETPEDIISAIPFIHKITEAFNVTLLAIDGVEADDVLGTLAKKAKSEGFITYIMTMDKDYGQLIEEDIFLFKPSYLGTGVDVWDTKKVLEKWGIQKVTQVTDMLGMIGDASDNIPGIPGIGEKTAKELINRFPSLEELIANVDKLEGKKNLKSNIMQFAEQGLLSKRLATIKTDVEIKVTLENLQLRNISEQKVKDLFNQLEFRTLSKRLFETQSSGDLFSGAQKTETAKQAKPVQTLFFQQSDSDTNTLFSSVSDGEKMAQDDSAWQNTDPSPLLTTIHNTPHNYTCCDTKEKRNKLMELLSKQKEFCLDSETTSLDPKSAGLIGLSFCWKKGEAWYLPFSKDNSDTKEILNELKPVLENEHIGKIGQNIKFDYRILLNHGIELKGEFFDTMLAHYLLEPDQRHNMNSLSAKYLNYAPVSIEELIGKKGKSQGKMEDVPLEKVAEYSAEDADVTFQLKEIFKPLLKESDLEKLFKEVEIPLIKVLADMEEEGAAVDIPALKEYSQWLENESEKTEKEIYKHAGVKFNIASPKQLGHVLFEVMKLESNLKKTKTGQYATGEEILTRLSYKHEVVQKILDYRQYQKLKSTYVDTLPLMVNKNDKRIHTTYNQAVASTGRLSSNNPNLQNIPIRTEKGKEVRKTFIPRKEKWVLMSADYSQIELRIMASVSEDKNMIEAFCEGQDIHTATASKVFNVAPEQVDGEMRRRAKMVNFGIIYGISAFGLSQRLGIPKTEAGMIIESYFAQYPGIKKYMDAVIEKARTFGYVETMLGRRRYLRDINSRNQTQRGFAERNAINAPIQGTAADMIKLAMIQIHTQIQHYGKNNSDTKLQSRLILQVHDELVFDVPEDEINILRPLVENGMKNALVLKVPLEVEISWGKNWLEAH